ncbi:MAG: helix-turn-helix transcriptional regulator, partial [Nocardioidaceae bacterium]
RDRVLALLRQTPAPMGVSAIGAATGLSANAVRFHLDHLVALGAARAAKDHGHAGPGRPALLYSAVPAEAVDPASAYRVLAGLLARELTRSGRPQASTDAGRAWARRMLPSLSSPRPADGTGAPDPVAVVLALFQDTGFEPVLASDGRTVELHRCPFLELATEQPEAVCGVHLGLVRGVLEEIGDCSTAALTPVLEGPGPCLVRLGAARSAPGEPASPASPASIEEPVP